MTNATVTAADQTLKVEPVLVRQPTEVSVDAAASSSSQQSSMLAPSPTFISAHNEKNHSQLPEDDSKLVFTFSSAPSGSFLRLLAESTGSNTNDSNTNVVSAQVSITASKNDSDKVAGAATSTTSTSGKRQTATVILSSSAGSNEFVEVDIVNETKKVRTINR